MLVEPDPSLLAAPSPSCLLASSASQAMTLTQPVPQATITVYRCKLLPAAQAKSPWPPSHARGAQFHPACWKTAATWGAAHCQSQPPQSPFHASSLIVAWGGRAPLHRSLFHQHQRAPAPLGTHCPASGLSPGPGKHGLPLGQGQPWASQAFSRHTHTPWLQSRQVTGAGHTEGRSPGMRGSVLLLQARGHNGPLSGGRVAPLTVQKPQGMARCNQGRHLTACRGETASTLMNCGERMVGL